MTRQSERLKEQNVERLARRPSAGRRANGQYLNASVESDGIWTFVEPFSSDVVALYRGRSYLSSFQVLTPMDDVDGREKPNEAATVAVAAALPPRTKVTIIPPDATVLRRNETFVAVFQQTTPLAEPGSHLADKVARQGVQGSTRANRVTYQTAYRAATSDRPLEALISCPQPKGKVAEFKAAVAIEQLHTGNPSAWKNPPENNAPNFVGAAPAPTACASKDLLLILRREDGTLTAVPWAQVKIGHRDYVYRSLMKSLGKGRYGKLAIVDARFVSEDGCPRVGRDAFTDWQAERLRKAGIRLLGIHDLEAEAINGVADVREFTRDGLTPLLERDAAVRRDQAVRNTYSAGRVATRALGSAAIGAASSAILSAVVQGLASGEIDPETIGRAALTGGIYGGVTTVVDAAVYHGAHKGLGLAPEPARAVAGQAVAGGLCLLAIGLDAADELSAFRRGDLTSSDALSGIQRRVVCFPC